MHGCQSSHTSSSLAIFSETVGAIEKRKQSFPISFFDSERSEVCVSVSTRRVCLLSSSYLYNSFDNASIFNVGTSAASDRSHFDKIADVILATPYFCSPQLPRRREENIPYPPRVRNRRCIVFFSKKETRVRNYYKTIHAQRVYNTPATAPRCNSRHTDGMLYV